jgi:hypothetical protein
MAAVGQAPRLCGEPGRDPQRGDLTTRLQTKLRVACDRQGRPPLLHLKAPTGPVAEAMRASR